ncbi:MAG: alpha/beta fold hydrolase [Gammaproteobacteria bacterium]|nr:alpha/beta fold hydrolase [Gammaproteobacteria bacterium]
MKILTNWLKVPGLLFICLVFSLTLNAGGEAGIISLRDQGHFYIGGVNTPPAENGSVQVYNQMYVGYQLPAETQHPYPLILVHGGGGQATDWFSTPDGRDGWRDYFLAAGFEVYWVDRPGYGRSPTNVRYGDLSDSANSSIINFLARSEHWPGNSEDPADENILMWLSSSPPGPYAGDAIAAADLSKLLDKIGPAILVTHSAGAASGWMAADMHADKVAGIISFEPGASNMTGDIRKSLTFLPTLPEDFSPYEDADGCEMQAPGSLAKLVNYNDIPVHLVGSELGLIAGLPCAVKVFEQAGVEVKYTYLPDLGFTGNGHFMMAETNNGELAQIFIDLATSIQ